MTQATMAKKSSVHPTLAAMAAAAAKSAPKTKPTKEEVRQTVLADQAAALKEAAAKPEPKTEKDKPEKKAKAKKERKADTRKITLLVKENPHEKGSRRAGWFAKLKNGMTVDDAVALGVRSVYLTRMTARKIVKLG